MPPKIRVYELSKELGLTNNATLDLCVALGVAVKTSSSSIDDFQADRVRRKAEQGSLVRNEQPPDSIRTGHKAVAPRRLDPLVTAIKGDATRLPGSIDIDVAFPPVPTSSLRSVADILLVLIDASRLPYSRAVGWDAVRPLMGPHTKACVVTLGEGGEVLVPGQPADQVIDVYWPSTLGRPSRDDTARVIGALHEVAHLSSTPSPTVQVLDLVYWQAFGEVRAAIEDFGQITMLGHDALGIKQTEEQKDLSSDAERMLRQGPIKRADPKSASIKGSGRTSATAPKPIPQPFKGPTPSVKTVTPNPTKPPKHGPTVAGTNPWMATGGPPLPPPPVTQGPSMTVPAGSVHNPPQPWGLPEPPVRSKRAVWSLIATIWCGIGSIAALWLAATALSEIKRSGGRITGAGYAHAAIAIAILEIVILISMA